MLRKLKILLAATMMVFGAASANATTVEFTVTNYGPSYGSFSGSDANSNGFLSRNELTSFQFDHNEFGHHVTLATLFGFGDFDIDPNHWIANGSGWGVNGSYFSWNGGSNSVHGDWAQVNTTITQLDPQGNVPEPASLALLALGLAGLGAIRRKQKAA